MKIKIYQINSERDSKRIKFFSYDSIKQLVGIDYLTRDLYDEVFSGEVNCQNLEEIYQLFNLTRPEGFTGHSLSMTDIVEILDDTGLKGCHFCDWIGFKKIKF